MILAHAVALLRINDGGVDNVVESTLQTYWRSETAMKLLDLTDAGVDRILRGLRNVSVVLLVVSITITSVNVVMRYIAEAPIFWADELALVTFVAVVYLPLGSIEKSADHLRLTVVLNLFGKRVRAVAECLRMSVSLVVGTYVTVVGFGAVYKNFILGNKTVALRLPAALTYGVIPVGFAMIAIVDVLLLLKSLSRNKAETRR
jgi:TRAP-type C4-dicarboxylate transport system permease small subunit